MKVVNSSGRPLVIYISGSGGYIASGVTLPANETYQVMIPQPPLVSGAVPTYGVTVFVPSASGLSGPTYNVPASGTLSVSYQVSTGLFS